MPTRDPIFGCLLVSGAHDSEGYAFTQNGMRAHKAAWIAAHGPIEDGKELDHICRRRNCVCTDHLELVTRSENELRKQWRYRVRRERCKHGHDLSNARLITPEGGIVCRTCLAQAHGFAR